MKKLLFILCVLICAINSFAQTTTTPNKLHLLINTSDVRRYDSVALLNINPDPEVWGNPLNPMTLNRLLSEIDNRIIGVESGGVTSVSLGYGILATQNPLVSVGSLKVDSAKLATRRWVDSLFSGTGMGTITSIFTTSPITGGTILSGSITIGINNAAADGSTKGAATFMANDFNSSSGLISIDYTNGQASDASHKGFLTSSDWTTFNNKGVGSLTSVSTSNGITGGTITGSGTISGINAAADGSTKGVASFTANDFNSSSGNISIDYANGQIASGSQNGFLSSSNWTTFNGKQNAITLTTTGTSGAATFSGGTLNVPNYTIVGNDTLILKNTGSVGYVLGKVGHATGRDTLKLPLLVPGTGITLDSSDHKRIVINATGSGSVTSLTAGTGITLSPSTITSTGSIAITTPVAPANGGTGTGALTAGSIPFINTGGVFDEENSLLSYDDINFRVGINTNAPLAPLEVDLGNVSRTNKVVYFLSTNGSQTRTFSERADGSWFRNTVLYSIQQNPSNDLSLGSNALTAVTFGGSNIASIINSTEVGDNAGANLISGPDNTTGFGDNATKGGTSPSGSQNTGIGSQSLKAFTSGGNNTGSGYATLTSLTTGNENVANGSDALANATTGSDNTALGFQAGFAVTTGGHNTIVGVNVGKTFGSNLGIGASSYDVVIGTDSTGAGLGDTSFYTTEVGAKCGFQIPGSRNTFFGADIRPASLSQTAFYQTGAFGYGARPDQSNEFVLGSATGEYWILKLGQGGTFGKDTTLWIEPSYSAAGTNMMAVYPVNFTGKLGTGDHSSAIGFYTGVRSGVLGNSRDSSHLNFLINPDNLGEYFFNPVYLKYSTFSSSTSEVRFEQSGGNYVGLSAGSSIPSTYHLKLPDTAAHAGEVLTSDASGNTYWSTPSGGGSSSLTSAHLFVGNGSNVATDVAASGDLSLANTGAFTLARQLAPTAVKTGNYTASVNDFVPCDNTSATFTVTLPTAPADKSIIGVKIVILGAGHIVNITAGGSDVFNKASGSTTLTLSTANASLLLQYKSSTAIWYVLSTDQGSNAANPTASVGTSVVNGSATTFMRSDAAPPIALNITPTWIGIHTFLQGLAGNTSGDGIVLSNSFAATAGNQSFSPALHFMGSGWKTNSTAGFQNVDFRIQMEPVQGTAAPSANLVFDAQINSGGFNTVASFGSDGSITGGPSSMIITSGTGNSRTLTLRTTTSGGTATNGLVIDASQHITLEGVTSTGATGSGKFVFDTSPDFTTAATIGGIAIPTISSTNTLTNKRITVRDGNTASSATPTINTDNVDEYRITALAVDITSMTTNLSGTPTEGQTLTIQITGTATRAITWGASFEASSIAEPTTTSSTTMLSTKWIWDSATTKWRLMGTW